MASLTDRNVRIWVGRATTAGSPVLGVLDRMMNPRRPSRSPTPDHIRPRRPPPIIAASDDPGRLGRIEARRRPWLAVHIGLRLGALAAPGEVLVAGTVKDLVVGSGIEFIERGEHELKGVPGTWKMFAVKG